MLLAVVAFQFIVSAYLPAVGYMTIMDRYICFTYVFLLGTFIVCLAFPEELTTLSMEDSGSHIFVGVVALLWALGHLIFVVIALRAQSKERTKLQGPAQEDFEYGPYEKVQTE